MNGDLALCDVGREHARAQRALAERSRDRPAILFATNSEGTAAARAGDWHVAREAASRGLEIDPRSVIHLSMMTEVECHFGNVEKAASCLGRMAEVMENVRSTTDLVAFPLFAQVAAQYSHVAETAEYLPAVERAAQGTLSYGYAAPLFALWAHSALGIRAYLTGDKDAAREQLERLQRFAGSIWGPFTVDHIRGLLFDTLGEFDDAVEAIETTLAYPQTGYGFRPVRQLNGVDAWTDDYADVMRVMMIPELQAVRKFFGLPTPVER